MGGSDELSTLAERVRVLEEANKGLQERIIVSHHEIFTLNKYLQDASLYRRLYEESEQKLANSRENTNDIETQQLRQECATLKRVIDGLKSERDKYHVDLDYYRRLYNESEQKQRDRKASARPYDPYGADHPGWDVS